MVLMSFSDKKHVPLIISGEKAQTTRKPRKSPIKVGDKLSVYFRSRMKKGTCLNCIQNCHPLITFDDCPDWANFFGYAKVTKIESLDDYMLNYMTLDDWAKADGFENFEDADEWFNRVYGPDWTDKDWEIIHFEGDWL